MKLPPQLIRLLVVGPEGQPTDKEAAEVEVRKVWGKLTQLAQCHGNIWACI